MRGFSWTQQSGAARGVNPADSPRAQIRGRWRRPGMGKSPQLGGEGVPSMEGTASPVTACPPASGSEVRANGDKDGSFAGGGEGRLDWAGRERERRCLSCGSGRRIYSSVREERERGVELKQAGVIIPQSVCSCRVEIIAFLLLQYIIYFWEHFCIYPWINSTNTEAFEELCSF